MTGAFDGFRHHSLVLGAGSGGTAGNDLAALRDELGAIASQYHLLIVQRVDFIHAEHADFPSRLTEFVRFVASRPPTWFAGCKVHEYLIPFVGKSNRLSLLVSEGIGFV